MGKLKSLHIAGVSLLLACLLPFVASSAEGSDQKRIYLAADDHTDYMWKSNAAECDSAMVEALNYYLDQIDSTIQESPPYQARWNCDGSYWVWIYEQTQSQAKVQRLIQRIRDKHVSVPLNTLVSCYGAAPLEGILRGMLYAGSLERRYNLRLNLALAMENQTLPYGLSSVWAGCGAKYSWRGICGCASRVPDAWNRQHDIYWWRGPDGAKILMKWNSMIWKNTGKRSNTGIGGYAEAREPMKAIEFTDRSADFKSRYPYSVIGIFGEGWDDTGYKSADIWKVAKARTTQTRQLIVSNEEDFFEDFESQYKDSLPSVSASLGNEWDTYSASMAETSSRVKRSVEKLRTAEALATYVTLQDDGPYKRLQAARESAWMSLGLFWEHNWTADGPLGRDARAAWQNQLALQIEQYADTLLDQSKESLGRMIERPGNYACFYVFNPLSWKRSDYADLPHEPGNLIQVIDMSSGKVTPSQHLRSNGHGILRIFAKDVPPLGYKTFEIVSRSTRQLSVPFSTNGGVFQNKYYRIKIDGSGAIMSLVDKSRANEEFVRTIGGRNVNEIGEGGGKGTVSVENVGPVSLTVLAKSETPIKHESRITLYSDIPRIDIRNDINENFGSVQTWAFSFALENPDTWHEETGAVIRARLLEDGGHYASRNARYDWLTLNHFVDLSDKSRGIIISNADCHFMRLGKSTASRLDSMTPQVSILAGGQVDGHQFGIPGQAGCTHFLQRFALRTYTKPGSSTNRLDSMKFALEHQNPLLAQPIEGGSAYPQKQFSLITISNPNLIVWTLKPSEDEQQSKIILRVWNLTKQRQAFRLDSKAGKLAGALKITHLETPLAPASISNGLIEEQVSPLQIASYRLDFKGHSSLQQASIGGQQ